MNNINENYILSSKDIKYNFDKWKNSTNGKLLITGSIGSGKTTLGKELSKKYNVELIQLDQTVSDEKYINKIKKENNKEDGIKKVQEYYQNLINNTISELLAKKEKLIIEGIQIFVYSNPNNFKDHSIILKGTSTLKSLYRAYVRNKKEDWSKNWSTLDLILDIYYNSFIKKINNFKKIVLNFKKNEILENYLYKIQ